MIKVMRVGQRVVKIVVHVLAAFIASAVVVKIVVHKMAALRGQKPHDDLHDQP